MRDRGLTPETALLQSRPLKPYTHFHNQVIGRFFAWTKVWIRTSTSKVAGPTNEYPKSAHLAFVGWEMGEGASLCL